MAHNNQYPIGVNVPTVFNYLLSSEKVTSMVAFDCVEKVFSLSCSLVLDIVLLTAMQA
jgi:hypothetical protein